MTGEDSRFRAQLAVLMIVLDGVRPAAASEWVSPVASVVTQAGVGAGHWAAGRRRRALAAWLGAAGFGLVAWGLATEAPTRAEKAATIEQQKDLLGKLTANAPAAAGIQALGEGPRSSRVNSFSAAVMIALLPSNIRHGLRRPRRLTAGAIAGEVPAVAVYALRVPLSVQRRRPRTAVGSALVVAAAVARLRAASAEPLR